MIKFKNEQGHKSISQSLTHILSKYLGLEKVVVHQSSLPFDNKFVTLEQFRDLEARVSSLSSELLSESIKAIENRISELQNEPLSSLHENDSLPLPLIALT